MMRKIPRTLILVGVVLATHLSFAVRLHAFSVGDLEVHSHLGVPFMAEVPLVMQPHERNDRVVVVIGNPTEYEQEGITRDPVIDQLQPLVITGPPERIRIVSEAPIQTPAFDLVLLVRTGHVTIVRHYSVGLSYPPAPVPVASAPAASAAVQPKEASAVASPRSTPPDAATVPAKPAWIQRLPQPYGPVRPGETLYRVMENLQIPRSVIWQVAVVTWQTNPSQFSSGNMHGLMSGQNLHFPPDLEQAIATLDVREAQRIIAEQWEAWQTLQHVELTKDDDNVPLTQMTAEGEVLSAQNETSAAATTVMLPTQQPSTPVHAADLQAVLKGLEDRLAQRLSVSSVVSAEPTETTTLPFVNTAELQTSLRSMESRLLEQLQRTILPHIQVEGAPALLQSKQLVPSLQDVKTFVAPLSSTNTLLYVLIGQNMLLFLLAVGFAWGWYRSRKQQALAMLSHPQTRHTRFIPVVQDAAVS